jgi:peroxiredoxin
MDKHRSELEALGAKVIAASADSEEHGDEFAKLVGFPVAYGVTREDADNLGAWWGEQRNNIQPAEFLLSRNGTVLHSLYASGPVGRMAPDELVRLLTRMVEMEKK